MKLGDMEYPSLKGKVSDEEWAARVELAAIFRLVPLMGWWDLSQAPCSARVPGEPDHYLFNPLGFLFEEITASSLVKITLNGEHATDTPLQFSRAIWYPMQAVHAVREDANWVIHCHEDYGQALSARKDLLLPISQTAGFALADGVAYHDYEGVETYEDQMESLQRSLGGKNRMILHNHGLLTVGKTAYQAFQRMSSLRKACRVQLLAGMGQDLHFISEDVRPVFAEELRRGPAVDNLWSGLLRKLDRIDPSYKD